MARRGERSIEKEAFWKRAVAAWQAAGVSTRAFCLSRGLKESAFYFWRRELARRAGQPEPGDEARRHHPSELARRAGLPARASSAGPVAGSPARKHSRSRVQPSAGKSRCVQALAVLPSADPAAMFLPLTVRTAGAETGAIEIVVGGHHLRVCAGFDEETLNRVLVVLERHAGWQAASRA